MSAIVCGKRSFFEELHSSPPSSSVTKRIRCSSSGSGAGTSPTRLSPPRSVPPSPIGHLLSIFPDMDRELIERALEACGKDLDSAIKSLTELRLSSVEQRIGSADNKSDSRTVVDEQLSSQDGYTTSGDPTAQNLPSSGSEWVDLFVSEMMNASDMADAKARASRVLEVLEKSIAARAGADAAGCLQKENMVLKAQVEDLIRGNTILKRAVAIQHERQKEYDEKNEELQQLKQLVSQYQEQLRTLEVNNYALTMHLRQAQQSNSMPGRFHPDVF